MNRKDALGTLEELSERIESIDEKIRRLDIALSSIVMKAQLSDCLLVIKKVDEEKAKEIWNDETRTAV
mgnify:FL=1